MSLEARVVARETNDPQVKKLARAVMKLSERVTQLEKLNKPPKCPNGSKRPLS